MLVYKITYFILKVLNVLQFNYYSFRKHGRGISRIFNLLPWYEESGEFSLATFKHFLFRILLSLVEQKMIESVAKYFNMFALNSKLTTKIGKYEPSALVLIKFNAISINFLFYFLSEHFVCR